MAEVSKKPRPKNTKRTGELSEAAFLHKAVAEGFGVAKPWGDSERYDFILDNGDRLLRVQVKCTAYLRARGYDIQPIYTDRTHKAAYTEKTSTPSSLTSSRWTSGTSYPSPSSPAPKACTFIPTRNANAPALNTIAKPGTCCAVTRVTRTLLSANNNRVGQAI
ncbi:MAG: hypothetical protein DMG91_03215 [Acidobacteria bacterium]|nr:MAG: hypothetical protein DMG91_03215 [Acidobacteriota bacterium]